MSIAKLDSGPEQSPTVMVGDNKTKQKCSNNRGLLTKVPVGLRSGPKLLFPLGKKSNFNFSNTIANFDTKERKTIVDHKSYTYIDIYFM